MKINREVASVLAAIMVSLTGCSAEGQIQIPKISVTGKDSLPTQTPVYVTRVVPPGWDTRTPLPKSIMDGTPWPTVEPSRRTFILPYGSDTSFFTGYFTLDGVPKFIDPKNVTFETQTPAASSATKVIDTKNPTRTPTETKVRSYRGTFQGQIQDYLLCTVAQITDDPSCSGEPCIKLISWIGERPKLISVKQGSCKASTTAAR